MHQGIFLVSVLPSILLQICFYIIKESQFQSMQQCRGPVKTTRTASSSTVPYPKVSPTLLVALAVAVSTCINDSQFRSMHQCRGPVKTTSTASSSTVPYPKISLTLLVAIAVAVSTCIKDLQFQTMQQCRGPVKTTSTALSSTVPYPKISLSHFWQPQLLQYLHV